MSTGWRRVAAPAALGLAGLLAAACGEPAGEGRETDAAPRAAESPADAPAEAPADREAAGTDGAEGTESAGAGAAPLPAGGAAAADTPPRAAQGAPAAGRPADGRERTPLRVGGVEVLVEVADRPEQRQQGLMNRDSLPENEGMLFVYPSERTLTFWMRNTRIPLDIAFIDRSGRIVDIQPMEPFDEEMTESRRSAMYALEMRQGWFEDHGVEVGDRVEF